MIISSPAFVSHGQIPAEYTCDGDNFNPPLEIGEVPDEAESLALIVDDPDAPSGVFTHWLVWNINPNISEIGEGETPEGAIEGTSDSGERGYAGPCPPSGTHHYIFRLFALDNKLSLKGGESRDEVEEAMEGHVVAQAELIGLYSHQEEESDEEFSL